jgi:hypothetical protein
LDPHLPAIGRALAGEVDPDLPDDAMVRAVVWAFVRRGARLKTGQVSVTPPAITKAENRESPMSQLAIITLLGGDGDPSHPIVIPPPSPGVPTPPIVIPNPDPGDPSHPIVIPPPVDSGGEPTHPIAPGGGPTHPIAPGGGGGVPTPPIYVPIVPPSEPTHPIVLPPESPGTPTHPIAPGGGKPTQPIAPGGERPSTGPVPEIPQFELRWSARLGFVLVPVKAPVAGPKK